MIMIHFRDPGPADNPCPDPYEARYSDEDYEMVLQEIDNLSQQWEQVWAYLEDDEDPHDWVMLFNNIETIRPCGKR